MQAKLANAALNARYSPVVSLAGAPKQTLRPLMLTGAVAFCPIVKLPAAVKRLPVSLQTMAGQCLLWFLMAVR